MTLPARMRFGIFMAPFHWAAENPTLSLERDMELLEWLDQLGYDEAWIGEHHSGGWETIASPEVFIAAAAQRTKHIKLGTGVLSLPYHHPLMVANRMILLDHMTRGRVMMGVGPGALVGDAFMLGIDPPLQRQRMDEALNIILRLWTETEPITYEADWFTLKEATVHLRPYTLPHIPIAVAASYSPAGMVCAGKYGLSVLSLNTISVPGAAAPDLAKFWDIAEETADKYGQTVSRDDWGIVIHVHLAPKAARRPLSRPERPRGDTRRSTSRTPWVSPGPTMGRRTRSSTTWSSHQQLVRRHPRRPGRHHLPPRRGVGRLRPAPDPGHRVGHPRAGPPQLRAIGPLRHAPIPGLGHQPPRVPGVVRQKA